MCTTFNEKATFAWHWNDVKPSLFTVYILLKLYSYLYKPYSVIIEYLSKCTFSRRLINITATLFYSQQNLELICSKVHILKVHVFVLCVFVTNIIKSMCSWVNSVASSTGFCVDIFFLSYGLLCCLKAMLLVTCPFSQLKK